MTNSTLKAKIEKVKPKKTARSVQLPTIHHKDLVKVTCGKCAGFGHWYELPPNKGKKGGNKV